MLDTKLKNSKKSWITGIVIVALAAGIFTALIPKMQRLADVYYAERGNDLEGESFLRVLFRSNYVLYEDVLGKSGEAVGSELFVEARKEDLEETSVNDYEEYENYGFDGEFAYNSAENIIGIYENQIAVELEEIRQNYLDFVSREMDYCVIDEKSGTVLKNTSEEIEKLSEGGTDFKNPYAYYVLLHYDENGVLSDIKLKGEKENTEQFYKTVQYTANTSEARLLSRRKKTEFYILADGETGKVTSRLILAQHNPENVTFIYAMTQKQQERYYDNYNGVYVAPYGHSREYIFYLAGAQHIILLLAAAMAVLVLLLAKVKPKLLYETKGAGWHWEVLVIVGIIVLAFLTNYGVCVAAYNITDGLVDWIGRYIDLENTEGAVWVEYGVKFFLMALMFGVWYWCLLGIKDIVNGIGRFLKERSLCRHLFKKVSGSVRQFVSDVSKADLGKDNKWMLQKIIGINFIILVIISCFWTLGIPVLAIYSFIVYGMLKNYLFKIRCQYGELLKAAGSIAEGNLNNTFEADFGPFESYKEELYKIQGGFSKAVEEEVKSQRMKTELITNVSHDLKTPLTAIITYIDLLKEENITEEQRKNYLDTLERKSLRLKVLIEDLFEVSKANSGNVKIEPVDVDICNLIRQVYLEHEEKMNQEGFMVRFEVPEAKVILQLDSQKTYRIFENLFGNIIKYAMPGTRVYVQVKQKEGNGVRIEMKNMSAQEITINPQDLTERFVRGDEARNTEGSGLGLAIAKSFTELQGGKFLVETDGDLFKVIIEW